jgi:hypothetical protein
LPQLSLPLNPSFPQHSVPSQPSLPIAVCSFPTSAFHSRMLSQSVSFIIHVRDQFIAMFN